jgi:hypothetical protein
MRQLTQWLLPFGHAGWIVRRLRWLKGPRELIR